MNVFISYKEKKVTEHNFCKKPFNFINVSNLSTHIKNSNFFINELIKELGNINCIWEPVSSTTKKGFQSLPILFENPSKQIKNLKSIIINQINMYYTKFKYEDWSYIKKWPLEKNIKGWCVALKQHGYQDLHIHADGWLSGVIYLKVPPTLGRNEGAIEFDLSGNSYYSDSKSPKKIHEPKVGDIVLFPSSLHHKTISFSTDEDRVIIAFDLKHDMKNNKL